MRRKKNTTFDATYEERIKLLQANPDLYFAEYPRPHFGFSVEKKSSGESRKKDS